jgi:thiamine-phosphate pyrophosphorylase
MAFKLIVVATLEEMHDQIQHLPGLFDGGLPVLHLRTKSFSENQFRKTLEAIPPIFHSRVVIHGYYELAFRFSLGGIHLTENSKTLPSSDPIFKRLEHLPISASFHSLEDLRSNTREFNYVFLSPVFDSISKPAYKSEFNPAELRSFLSEFKSNSKTLIPVMSLGGINEKTVLLSKEMGFDGAVISGAIWKSKDPLKTLNKIQQVCL